MVKKITAPSPGTIFSPQFTLLQTSALQALLSQFPQLIFDKSNSASTYRSTEMARIEIQRLVCHFICMSPASRVNISSNQFNC